MIADELSAARRVRPLTVLAIAAVVVAVLLVAALAVGRLMSQHRVDEELARIHAAGEPVTPEDLEAFYALPPGFQNTSALWLAAAKAVSQPAYEAEAAMFPIVGAPIRDEHDPGPELPERGRLWVYDLAAEKFLAKHADILATLHEAAAMGGEARFPTTFEDGVGMPLDGQIELRFVARLLAFEREVNLRRGDGHAATGSVRALFALARAFKREPLLIAELYRVTFDGMAIAGLQRLLLLGELSDGDLAALDRDVAALEYHRQFHEALLGERVCMLHNFDDPDLLGTKPPSGLAWLLFRPADRAVFLQCMRELIAASAAPDYPSLQTAVDRTQRDITAMMAAPGANWRYPMSKSIIPSVDDFAGAVGRGTARREVARAAIAVERFRRANGHLPNGLKELVPEYLPQALIDPFTGGPLHWVASGDEYRVYSVGHNGLDEGGVVEEADDKGDICIRGRKR